MIINKDPLDEDDNDPPDVNESFLEGSTGWSISSETLGGAGDHLGDRPFCALLGMYKKSNLKGISKIAGT